MTPKILGALVLTAALFGHVFAREYTAPQRSTHSTRHIRGSYRASEPAVRPPTNAPYFDRSFDPSRIGNHDPNFNPSPT